MLALDNNSPLGNSTLGFQQVLKRKTDVGDPNIIPLVQRPKNGKHLILDLDETLVHTFENEAEALEFANEMSEAEQTRFYAIDFPDGTTLYGYIRPYVETFLNVAFNEFDSVGVWSAGTEFYVNAIVNIVFKNSRPQLRFVLSRNACNEIKIDHTEPCRFKPLSVIYHMFPDHNDRNTVIVDDRKDICSLNCMNNIQVPEFVINATNAEIFFGDETLLTLAKWFMTDLFRNSPDVRLVKSKSPFKI